MTQEEKDLLLRDLSARFPYGVTVEVEKYHIGILKGIDNGTVTTDRGINYPIGIVKPYLRSMSSMTEEECVELSKIRPFDDEVEAWKYIKTPVPLKIANIKHFDFFHSHYLDWRGLIEKGLALEAPKDMYNIK